MTISKDITKDYPKLSKFVGKTVIDYIVQQKSLNKAVQTKDLINYVYNKLGFKDEILTSPDVRKNVNEIIEKTLSLLEKIEAIKPECKIVNEFASFLKMKNSIVSENIRPLSINKAKEYNIDTNFFDKVALLKTNEQIINSGIAIFTIEEKSHSVIVAKNCSLDLVKKCNDIFDYSAIANYIGTTNENKDRIDLVGTKVDPMRFYSSQVSRTNPTIKEMENLYYLINFSPEYKNLFFEKHASAYKPMLGAKIVPTSKALSSDSLFSNATM